MKNDLRTLALLVAAVVSCSTFAQQNNVVALKADPYFHALALPSDQRPNADKNWQLPFDAFVVGVDKDNASRVGKQRECTLGKDDSRCLRFDAPYFADKPEILSRIRGKIFDPLRPTFVSHIARFSADQPDGCLLFTVFQGGKTCSGVTVTPAIRGEVLATGWNALELLSSELGQRVMERGASHLILLAMGWNTPQWEALQNYRALQSQLQAAATADGDTQFKPVFVGLTWPSTGSPFVNGIDYTIKAGEADEVGAVWLNLLLHRVISKVKEERGVRVIVLGHSFGARATSRAVFSAPLVRDEPWAVADLLIGLQGAYSFQRYMGADGPRGYDRSPYRDMSRFTGQVALTASSRDEAVRMVGHEPYFVGSIGAWTASQHPRYVATFDHQTADADGLPGLVRCGGSRVLYIDASALIANPVEGTGGGAHSDIYNAGVGRLNYQLIRGCAP